MPLYTIPGEAQPTGEQIGTYQRQGRVTSHNKKALHKHMYKCFAKCKRTTEMRFKMPRWFLAQHRAGTSPNSVQSGSLLGCGYIVISDYTRYYLVKSLSPCFVFATSWCFFCPNEHSFRGHLNSADNQLMAQRPGIKSLHHPWSPTCAQTPLAQLPPLRRS